MPKTETPMMAPVHPGEMLKEDFLDALGVSQYRLAQAIGVPPRRINEIVHGTRRISADTALRLSRFFGMSDGFWMNLQGHYDIEVKRTDSGRPSPTSSRWQRPADRLFRHGVRPQLPFILRRPERSRPNAATEGMVT